LGRPPRLLGFNACSPFFQEPTKVTFGHFNRITIYIAACALAATAVVPVGAYAQESSKRSTTARGILQGYVRDSSGKPVWKATVFLQIAAETSYSARPTSAIEPAATHTDSEGAYRFWSLEEGSYNLRAQMNGYHNATIVTVSVTPNVTTKIDLVLVPLLASDPPVTKVEEMPQSTETTSPKKPRTEAPEFFDEPQFTVAGVTQAANSGGHGSDTAVRTTEALAKATVSLSKEAPGSATADNDSTAGSNPTRTTGDERSLRDILAREPDNFDANRQLGQLLANRGNAAAALPYVQRASQLNPGYAEVHHRLGDVEEKLEDPLNAVHEYQRAAELDPSELNLFDWGAELLAHRALEPATEVLSKGNRLFPKSRRMLVALGVAWYARGSYERAAQSLMNASDLDPDDPTPYLFLGKIQSVEIAPLEGSLERFARFARLQPENALANYYYAVGLWKQPAEANDPASGNDRLAHIEALLTKAAQLDPKLAAAHLQLGILYSGRGDFARAIPAYRQAIAVDSNLDDRLAEMHYRLAQAYLRIGDKAKSQEELELHAALNKQTKQYADRQRRDIQEFVISRHSPNSTNP
jgi:tetratricopeptide (TPR) repeat protein/protocatechuate 3,4-dioxygenase beta subunit